MIFIAFLLAFILSGSVAQAGTPAVDPALCQAYVKHVPAADVAYQPGVDVRGKKVAPAELPGQSQIELPKRLEFPLTVSLANLLNLDPGQPPASQMGTGTEAVLGVIAVEGDKAYFNGKPLTDAQQDNLAVLCMQQNPPGAQ